MNQNNFEVTKVNNCTLYLGNCFVVTNSFPDCYFDSCVSSPPFINEDFDVLNDREYISKYGLLLNQLQRKVSDYSLLFNSSTRLSDLYQNFKIYRQLVWDKWRGQTPYRFEPILVHEMRKPRFSFNVSCFCDCYHTESVDIKGRHKVSIEGKDVENEYENPVDLYQKFLLNILTLKDGLKFTRKILDPFVGSGTTLIACLNLGLECVGIERDPKIYRLAAERLKAWPNELESKANPKTVSRIADAQTQMVFS